MTCWYPNTDTDATGYDDDTEGTVKARQTCPHCEEYAPDVWLTGPQGSFYVCPACGTHYPVEENSWP